MNKKTKKTKTKKTTQYSVVIKYPGLRAVGFYIKSSVPHEALSRHYRASNPGAIVLLIQV